MVEFIYLNVSIDLENLPLIGNLKALIALLRPIPFRRHACNHNSVSFGICERWHKGKCHKIIQVSTDLSN